MLSYKPHGVEEDMNVFCRVGSFPIVKLQDTTLQVLRIVFCGDRIMPWLHET